MTESIAHDILAYFINSGLVYMLFTGLLFFFFFALFYWLGQSQEKWKLFEGSIITAIKLAEKQIGSDTPNAGVAKLDAALHHVLKDYAEAHRGRKPSRGLVKQIRQGIQIKHNELDRWGGLAKRW